MNVIEITEENITDYINVIPQEYCDDIKPLSVVSSRQFKAGVMTSVFHGRYGLLDDLPFLPMTRYDADISCCIETDDKILESPHKLWFFCIKKES